MATPPLLPFEEVELPNSIRDQAAFSVPPSPPVGGRLGLYWNIWATLPGAVWQVKLLSQGLTLQFVQMPPLSVSPIAIKLPLNVLKRQVLLQEIQSLLDKEAIEVVSDRSPGFYSHLFTVPKRSGGFRPVVDLKRLNKFIHCPHFHMETDRAIRAQLVQGEWAASIDMSDAYLHIPIHPAFKKYLRLHVLGKSYQFRAMCFGLNIAPRIFTKLLDPVASHIRSRGIIVHRYLDDWLIRGPSPAVVANNVQVVLDLFHRLGLLVNFKKSELVPKTRFVFLGMDVDLALAWVRPTEAQLSKIAELIAFLSGCNHSPVRLLLSVIGSLNHASQFIPLGRLHLRPLQLYVKALVPNLKESIDASIPLKPPFHQALSWWKDQVYLKQGVPLQPPETQVTLITDASLQGWGAVLGDQRCAGKWAAWESCLHISLLELRAVRRALEELQQWVVGLSVRLLCDNTVAVAYLRNQGGTRSVSLFQETRDILLWCAQQQVTLRPFYLPGHLNSVADMLSRSSQVLGTEWTLHAAIFRQILVHFPDLDVDLFATSFNNQLPRFVSPCPDPAAWKADAFSMEWREMSPYAFPPFKLVSEVLRKLRNSPIRLILVAPAWANQSWYPELLDLLYDLPLQIPGWRRLLRQPLGNVFHHNPQMLQLHVWPLSGLASDRLAFQERLQNMQQHRNVHPPYDCTSPTGGLSLLGVKNSILIQAEPLFNK